MPWKLKKRSEFDVQAEAFHILRSAGLDVRGEVRFDYGNGYDRFRADLVILKADTPVLILEIKRSDKPSRSKQPKRYETLSGVPCILIRPADLPRLIEIVAPFI